jgi:hypothetical protein
LVSQTNIIGFPKVGIFSIAIIVFVFLRKNNIIAGFAIGINRVFAVGIRGYFGAYIIYTESKVNLFCTLINMLGGYDRKEKRTWGSSDISYMILKCRGDASREGNNITNTHVTRGP